MLRRTNFPGMFTAFICFTNNSCSNYARLFVSTGLSWISIWQQLLSQDFKVIHVLK